MTLIERWETARKNTEPLAFTPTEYEELKTRVLERPAAVDYAVTSILGYPYIVNAEAAARQSLGKSACNCIRTPDLDDPHALTPGETPCPLHTWPEP